MRRKNFCFSQSVTSSPALSRKSSKTNIKSCEGLGKLGSAGKSSKSNIVYDCDKSYDDRVSEDINDMVEQIQAIHHDISELAGRPISLIDQYKHWRSCWEIFLCQIFISVIVKDLAPGSFRLINIVKMLITTVLII